MSELVTDGPTIPAHLMNELDCGTRTFRSTPLHEGRLKDAARMHGDVNAFGIQRLCDL